MTCANTSLMADSVPSAIPTEFADLLNRPLIAHMATVRADGTPQVSPMWFMWDGGQLVFTSTRARQKHANILACPAVAVSIVDPNTVRHIELRGAVIAIEADLDCVVWREMSKLYGDPACGVPRDAADRVVYRFEPRHVATFARSPDWSPLLDSTDL